jgi:hypothetical protein
VPTEKSVLVVAVDVAADDWIRFGSMMPVLLTLLLTLRTWTRSRAALQLEALVACSCDPQKLPPIPVARPGPHPKPRPAATCRAYCPCVRCTPCRGEQLTCPLRPVRTGGAPAFSPPETPCPELTDCLSFRERDRGAARGWCNAHLALRFARTNAGRAARRNSDRRAEYHVTEMVLVDRHA